MTNTEIFIEKYKLLEEAVRSAYDLKSSDSISYYLSRQEEYRRYRNDIKYCQEVRNLLSHKKKLGDAFAVEPSKQMIRFLDRLIEQVRNRPRCRDIQIRLPQVYWQPPEGKVKGAIRVMRERRYTHVPILEKGRVTGVFDENSVFSYLADRETVAIDDGLCFRDIRSYISLRERETEEFLFFRENAYVEEIEDAFTMAFQQGKRIGIAFLTPSGRETEPLSGILTPWDIIAAEE